MSFLAKDHTFSICAYKDSPYLEECLQSLQNQTVQGNIILCTSTPTEQIRQIAGKYQIPVYVNPIAAGIASDWNYALEQPETSLVTLAHQDDIYEPEFLESVLLGINRSDGQTIISFTDYYEISYGRKVYAKDFQNLRLKQALLFPLRIISLQENRWLRRRMLSFANPICCPSVTYVKDNIEVPVFQNQYKSDLDWQAWENLSRIKGRFSYVNKPLMGHRMYAESTTLQMIMTDNSRTREDFEMLKLFWPKPLARIICMAYSRSQRSRIKNEKRKD